MRLNLFAMARYQFELLESAVMDEYRRVRFYINAAGQRMVAVYSYMSDREEIAYMGTDDAEAMRIFRHSLGLV